MAIKLYMITKWLIFLIVIAVLYALTVIYFKNVSGTTTPTHKIKSPHPIIPANPANLRILANSTIHAAVVIALSKQTSHIAEFHLLYDSWRFIQNFSPLSQEVIVDLIVFCEQPSCPQLPSACLPLSFNKKFDRISRCFYEELDPQIVKEWQNYLYMTSIAFMLTKEFREATANYRWILRVDQDAILSPGLFYGLKGKHPVKLYDMQFGGIGHGIDFTHERLREIAKKLGYKHAGIHNLCSTWLVSPHDAIILANYTTKIGKHFLKNEYGKHVPGIEDLPAIGTWPKWWRGVTSLYAAEIGINDYYFGKLGRQHGTSALDHPAYSGSSVWNAWHIHCLHNPDEFAKFKHRDDLRAFLKIQQSIRNEKKLNVTATQNVLRDVFKEFQQIEMNNGKITGKIPVKDYVTALAWQKAYAGTGAINLDH